MFNYFFIFIINLKLCLTELIKNNSNYYYYDYYPYKYLNQNDKYSLHQLQHQQQGKDDKYYSSRSPSPPSPPPSLSSSLQYSDEYNYLNSLFNNVSKFSKTVESYIPNKNSYSNDLNKNGYLYTTPSTKREDDSAEQFYKSFYPPHINQQINDFIKDQIEYKYENKHHDNKLGLILGLSLGLPIGLIVLAIILRFCFKKKCDILFAKWKKRTKKSFKSNLYNKNSFDKSNLSPNDSKNDPWAMDKSKITIEFENKLGSGAFCNVHKGYIKGSAAIRRVFPDLIVLQKFTDCDVAVKLLPPFADDIARSDFNQEINFMKSLNYHPHLICMLGYVPDPRNPLLLVEYCSNGDLLHLIRNHRIEIEHGYENSNGLKIKDLVSYAWQISDGLSYLNSIGCIHRDVAARNVLVDADNTCKIADFGLCRLTDNLLYTARGGRLPLRWMAPESLKSFEYSFKTDVWSYGILLWELLSLGEVPYNSIDNHELLIFLESGQRLQKPIYCPTEIYDIMKSCWRNDPCLRPDFIEICKILIKIIESANDDYGYLIPIANFASIENYIDKNFIQENSSIQVKIDDV